MEENVMFLKLRLHGCLIAYDYFITVDSVLFEHIWLGRILQVLSLEKGLLELSRDVLVVVFCSVLSSCIQK